jgi:predicted transcriptional regulator
MLDAEISQLRLKISATENEYESFAEWKVRRISEPSKEPHETYGQRLKTWVLSSIGIDGTGKELFLYLENSKAATLEDLAKHVNEEPEEVLELVDLLYSTGLIERLGKAYYVREPLSTSIVRRLIPRITESLRNIAKAESRARSDATYYCTMRGRAFSDVGSAIAVCKEISRIGGSPIARVVGVHSYSDETLEVEGPVSDYGHTPQHLVIITESGEKVVVGNRNSRGADVKAHSIIVKGEKNE